MRKSLMLVQTLEEYDDRGMKALKFDFDNCTNW